MFDVPKGRICMQEQQHSLQHARAVLKTHWGYDGFRPGQEAVVGAVLEGRDVFAILPTGGGKSICYQVPALLSDGLTLVISPLIALMQDQVAGLGARGVPAAFINSTLSAREVDQRWTDAEFGRYRLLYVAPERLQSDMFLARAGRLNISLLAVDEAHCISEWGHHFRPAYLDIAQARTLLGHPTTLAVTATATPEVRRDIVEHLALRDPEVIVRGFDRPNVIWSIFRTENKRKQVRDVLSGVPGSGLLYAATRHGAEDWAAWLTAEGETVAAYHGGMKAVAREKVQHAWVAGKTRLVAATNAFGMGIDKPDVRFVIHVDMPASLESYYQEAGRAGRDGEKAYAVLLFREGDDATQRTLIAQSHPDAKVVRQVYDAICNLAQLPVGSLPADPVMVNQDAVARLTGFAPGLIRTAMDIITRQEVWQVLPMRRHHGLIRFLQPADEVLRYAESLRNAALATFVQDVLRTVHADAFSDWWEIDLRILESRLDLPRPRLLKGLDFLEERGLIGWRAPGDAHQVQFAQPRTQRLPVDDLPIRRDERRATARLDDMLRYARSVTCRRHFLLAYFGEKSLTRCGKCDMCLGRHRAVVITPEDEPIMRHILHQVEQEVPSAAWFGDALPERQIDGLVDWLVQEGYLRVEQPLEAIFALTPKAYTLMNQWPPREE